MKKQKPRNNQGNSPLNDAHALWNDLAEMMPHLDMDALEAAIKEEIRETAGKDKEMYDELMCKLALAKSSTMVIREGGRVIEYDWNSTHPFGLTCSSDKFYASFATELLYAFCCKNYDGQLPDGVLRSAAMSISAYLEDLVSGTGIWNAVRKMYREQNNRAFPFYDIDPEDYFDDDLNIEDVKLLIWQAFNRIGNAEARVFSPMSPAVQLLAETAYDSLIENFDKAPCASRVADRLRKVMRNGDYLEVRTLGYWLSVLSPLTAAPYAIDNMMDMAKEDYEEYSNHLDIEMYLYSHEARNGWMDRMSLNGCPSYMLLSVMAENAGHSSLADKLRNVKVYEHIVYTIENKTKTHILVKDRIGRTFNVVKDSFAGGVNLKALEAGYGDFVRYGNDYYLNGLSFFFNQMDNSAKETKIFGITDEMLQLTDEIVRKNRGRRLYYCKDLEEVSEHMPLNLPIKSADQLGEDADKDILLILSSTDGPILKPGMCSMFKDKANPFYNNSIFEDLGMKQLSFIADSYMPDDVIEYIVSHNLLHKAYIHTSQGKRLGKALVQDNMAFLMRFYRVDSFSKPLPDHFDTDV